MNLDSGPKRPQTPAVRAYPLRAGLRAMMEVVGRRRLPLVRKALGDGVFRGVGVFHIWNLEGVTGFLGVR